MNLTRTLVATAVVAAAFGFGRGYSTPLEATGPAIINHDNPASAADAAAVADDSGFPDAITRAGGARDYGTTIANWQSAGGFTVTDIYPDDGATTASLATYYQQQITNAGWTIAELDVAANDATTIVFVDTDNRFGNVSITPFTEPDGTPIVLVSFSFTTTTAKAQP